MEQQRVLLCADDGVQAAASPMRSGRSPHDVWQDDPFQDGLPHSMCSSSPSEDMEREWRARQQQFQTLGYRDGVTEGQKFSAQEGFNAGFQEAAAAGFNWGVARGFVSAFAALPACAREIIVKDDVSRTRLEALHSTVASISTTDALQLYYQELVASATPGDKTQPSVQNDAISIEEPESSLNVYTESKKSSDSCSTSGSGGLSSQYGAVRGEEAGASLIQTSESVATIDGFNKQIPSEPAVSPESRQSSKPSPCIEIYSGEDFQVHTDKSIAESSIGPIVDLSSHSHLNVDSVSSFVNMSISSSLHAPVTSPRSLEDFQKKISHEFELASLKCPIKLHL